jgi:hypothetical protein
MPSLPSGARLVGVGAGQRLVWRKDGALFAGELQSDGSIDAVAELARHEVFAEAYARENVVNYLVLPERKKDAGNANPPQ